MNVITKYAIPYPTNCKCNHNLSFNFMLVYKPCYFILIYHFYNITLCFRLAPSCLHVNTAFMTTMHRSLVILDGIKKLPMHINL